MITMPAIYLSKETTSYTKSLEILPEYEVEWLKEEKRTNVHYIQLEICTFKKNWEIPPLVNTAEIEMNLKLSKKFLYNYLIIIRAVINIMCFFK